MKIKKKMKSSEFLNIIEYLRRFPDADLKITYNHEDLDFDNISVTSSVSTNAPINITLNFEKRKDDSDIIYVYRTDGTTDGYEEYDLTDGN